jgi:hypothetical protein
LFNEGAIIAGVVFESSARASYNPIKRAKKIVVFLLFVSKNIERTVIVSGLCWCSYGEKEEIFRASRFLAGRSRHPVWAGCGLGASG